MSTERISGQIFILVNQVRKKHGLPPVKELPQLRELAHIQSQNMAEKGYFAHTDHLGRTPKDRKMTYFPELFGGVGENIASVAGLPPERLAAKFMQVWMDSPGHRENILRKRFNYLGVSVVQRGGAFYATQVFGDLVAVLQTPLRKAYNYGTEHYFRFTFLGAFPRRDLSIMVQFPDKQARFFVSETTFYTGSGILKPVWHGQDFSIRLRFIYGAGDYILNLGQKGTYYEGGLKIKVR